MNPDDRMLIEYALGVAIDTARENVSRIVSMESRTGKDPAADLVERLRELRARIHTEYSNPNGGTHNGR